MKHIGIDFLKHVPYLIKENYKSVLPYKKEGANDLYFNDLQSCAALLKEKQRRGKRTLIHPCAVRRWRCADNYKDENEI